MTDGSVPTQMSPADGGRFAVFAGQVARFGVVGVLAAAVNIGVYWLGVEMLGIAANLAWGIGFVAALLIGYPLQSGWSFGGHGGERNVLASGGRYLVVALIGLAINSFWVFMLVSHFGLPTWAPIPLVLAVTPGVVFLLTRYWVFR